MPKMKTNKSIAKRFKVTGTGKLARRKSGQRHLLSTKSKNRKRVNRKDSLAKGKVIRTYKRLMGA
ncbi:MAG: 50S ribosomal protein L35 [Planctomycetes bacterium]|nr:50S ribosomal protein L35 [Planctomycetota bacterium]